MVTNSNLEQLYRSVLDKKELTTKELTNCGFSSHDIKKLIDDGVIKRVEKGKYQFLQIHDFYFYGKKLIATHKYQDAYRCFQRCLQLDPNYKSASFQLFVYYIQKEQYDKALEYYDQFSTNSNAFYQADSNFYLYLLSLVTEIPEKYQEKVKNFKYEDFRVSKEDKRFQDCELENRLRYCAFEGRMRSAWERLLQLEANNNYKLNVQDLVIKKLLIVALKKSNQEKKEILSTIHSFIDQNQYEELINYIDELKQKGPVFLTIHLANTLANAYLEIKKTQQIPEIEVTNTDDYVLAIDGKNYPLAMQLILKYQQERKKQTPGVLYYILKDIIEECKKIEERQENFAENLEIPSLDFLDQKEEIKPITVSDIYQSLMMQDIDTALPMIQRYLSQYQLEQYNLLVTYFIKLSMIEKDFSFTKPMTFLTQVPDIKDQLNSTNWVLSFYQSIQEKNREKAQIYFDILSRLDCFQIPAISQENLKSLERLLDTLPVIEKEEIIEKEEKTNSLTTLDLEEEPIKEEKKEEQVVEVKEDILRKEDTLIEAIIIAREKGLSLLEPMNDFDCKQVRNYMNQFDDIYCLKINTEDGLRVALRKIDQSGNHFNFKEVIHNGLEAYYTQDYDTSITELRKVLESRYPKPFVYGKLGLSYLRKNDKQTALNYLIVATALGAKEKNPRAVSDYTEMIKRLSDEIRSEKEKEPLEKKTNPCPIEHGMEVMEFVSQGESFEQACEKYEIVGDKRCELALFFAKICYAQGYEQQGDFYVDFVEKSKDKSEVIINMLEEIKKHKETYQQEKEEYKVLKLVPTTKMIQETHR